MRLLLLIVAVVALAFTFGCSGETSTESANPVALVPEAETSPGDLAAHDPERYGPTVQVFGPTIVTRMAPDGGVGHGPEFRTFVIDRTDLHTFHSPFQLRVTNGDVDGTRRVSSASILIDGQEIIAPSAFSPRTEVIERLVELSSGSVLEVRVSGRLDGRLEIVILGVGLVPHEYVYIEPGSFVMGSPEDEPGRDTLEERRSEAQHPVTLTRGFYMSKFEVTESRWNEAMGLPPVESAFPKVNVTWRMTIDYCNALSRREGLTPAYVINPVNQRVSWDREANGYRLPTDAEWEYACRAGSTTAFANGPITDVWCSDPLLDQIAWYCGNYPTRSRQPVGLCPVSNAWGLYDMHGNVYEWIWDGFLYDYERLGPIDPVHEVIWSQTPRVIRSAPWSYDAGSNRSASRTGRNPAAKNQDLGFRTVRTAPR